MWRGDNTKVQPHRSFMLDVDTIELRRIYGGISGCLGVLDAAETEIISVEALRWELVEERPNWLGPFDSRRFKSTTSL